MKKSEQSKNKSVLLYLSKKTKTKSETLGDVELKYISYGDTIEFAKVLQEQLQDKDFVAKILFHQLIKPKINFDDFNKLSNIEIESLARAFVKNEDHTFKYFQDTGDFFKDFKQALTQGLAEVTKQIGDTQRRLIESIKPVIEQCQSVAKNITEFWQKWAEQNRSVFEKIGKHWSEFQKKYQQIAEQKAVGVLQKYKWFISPSMPIDFVFKVVQLGQKKGRQDKVMNKLFVDYFSRNHWHNLEAIMQDWEKNTLFKKRIKIIRDCIETLKNANNKTNAVNVVLPTLIAQIDGFLSDYLDSKGIPYDCAYDDFIQNGKIKKVGRKSQFKKNSSKALTSKLDLELANDIFLNILFQHSQKGKPLKTPFNFNRHKIMHGENINYGRKNYLIRSFLLIDFLVSLK